MRVWINLLMALSLGVTASISAAQTSMPDGDMSSHSSAMSEAIIEGMDNSSSPHHHQACDKCPPVFTGDPGQRDLSSEPVDYNLGQAYGLLPADLRPLLPDWLNSKQARGPPARLILDHRSI